MKTNSPENQKGRKLRNILMYNICKVTQLVSNNNCTKLIKFLPSPWLTTQPFLTGVLQFPFQRESKKLSIWVAVYCIYCVSHWLSLRRRVPEWSDLGRVFRTPRGCSHLSSQLSASDLITHITLMFTLLGTASESQNVASSTHLPFPPLAVITSPIEHDSAFQDSTTNSLIIEIELCTPRSTARWLRFLNVGYWFMYIGQLAVSAAQG